MEYWNDGILGFYSIPLKNITIHEISKPWIEKTSTEGLKSLGFGKTLSPFTSWPVKYLPTSHLNSRK